MYEREPRPRSAFSSEGVFWREDSDGESLSEIMAYSHVSPFFTHRAHGLYTSSERVRHCTDFGSIPSPHDIRMNMLP